MFIVSVTIFCTDATGQSVHTVSGYIREKGSRELLIGVNIYAPFLEKGTVSNRYGFYSLPLPAGTYELIYSYVGYHIVREKIILDKDIELDIFLEPSVELEGVEIKADRYEKVTEMVQMSVLELPVSQVNDIPALLGEKDVFKALQLMPGVQSGSEGSSGLYVRGGGPDQNLIILDDATVYNANHLFGFFSLFNGDALKSIELIKGGFPARYGGRLSSVVEMNMKDGNKEDFKGEAGIGLISSRLTLEGPLKSGVSSFLFSGRRTYIDVLTRPLMPEDEKLGYYFYDLNAKLNYDFSKKDKLYLSGYFGKDKFGYVDRYGNEEDEAGLFWENATASLRWNHLFNNRLFSNASFIFSNYRLNIYEDSKYEDYRYSLDYTSSIRDFSFKYDLEFHPASGHTIRGGFLTTYHRFRPSAVVIKESEDNGLDNFESRVNDINTLESGLYVEDEVKIQRKCLSMAGLRLSHFVEDNKQYLGLEPRLAASYRLMPDLALKASYALMNQYVHLLSNTGLGLPTDLWVPSTDNVKPQRSQQIAAGLAKDLTKQNLAITIEGYYKKMDDIIGYKEGATFLLIEDPTGAEAFTWEDNITSGQGWAYGMEFLVQRKTGKLTGWVGYTLSWTQLQFDEINFGKNTLQSMTAGTMCL